MSTIVDQREHTQSALNTIVEHWAKARIETPLQVTSRLDDSAKYILGVAGVLQGILIAVVKLEPEVRNNIPQLSGYSIGALLFLILTALLAAISLFVQSSELATLPVYDLFRTSTADRQTMDELDKAVKRWCESNDRVLRSKRILLTASMISLVISMSFSLACVWTSMNHDSAVPTAWTP